MINGQRTVLMLAAVHGGQRDTSACFLACILVNRALLNSIN